MFNFIKFFLVLFILGFVSTLASAQKKSTYKMGETTYLVGEYYKKSSYPKVQRSSANRNEFLRSKGYSGPIIALTAHAMKDEQDRCIRSGFNDFLTKPIHRESLISVLERYDDGAGA